MSKHTPGPWFTAREGYSTVYIEARIGGGYLQEVAACGPTAAGIHQQTANARLIAAAPDLLEALELMLATIPPYREDGECTIPDTMIQVVNAAIKKATS